LLMTPRRCQGAGGRPAQCVRAARARSARSQEVHERVWPTVPERHGALSASAAARGDEQPVRQSVASF